MPGGGTGVEQKAFENRPGIPMGAGNGGGRGGCDGTALVVRKTRTTNPLGLREIVRSDGTTAGNPFLVEHFTGTIQK